MVPYSCLLDLMWLQISFRSVNFFSFFIYTKFVVAVAVWSKKKNQNFVQIMSSGSILKNGELVQLRCVKRRCYNFNVSISIT